MPSTGQLAELKGRIRCARQFGIVAFTIPAR